MLAVLIFAMILTTQTNFAQTPPLEAGVSQTLAKWRAANYSDVRYKLNITLEKGAPLMKGDIEIRVNLSEEGAKNHLILDWRTTQFANDKDKPYAHVTEVNGKSLLNSRESVYGIFNEHLQIGKEVLKTGENIIKIEFASPIKTSGAAITRYVDKEDGAEYVYSLFVPSDASTAFPVFDQPDLKARFSLTVIAPRMWSVVTNSRLKYSNRSDCSNSQNYKDCPEIYYFNETQQISTYVFAFAAGEFAGFTECYFKSNNPICRPIPVAQIQNFSDWEKGFGPNIYVRKSQAEKFKQHAAEVFQLNREGVKFLESWFDYKFPFPKYDLVLIPEFPFGGMEHAGATFLREDRVIFPTEPTKNDYITRANVIFHEAAHQWFGDTVTMRWFDDLWLKEGFAEFMAYKTLEKVMPEYNAWKIFYERNKQLAYLTDSTKGTTPIYQEIPNLSAAKSAYGNIVYRKAPSFLRQAEFYLGEDKFQTAVRAFLKKHEFANAEWTDLVKEFELASKQDLKDWANVWVKQRGLPKVVSTSDSPNSNCVEKYFLKQTSNSGEDAIWKMRVKTLILFEAAGTTPFSNGKNVQDLELGNKESIIYQRNTCQNMYFPRPKFIFPNYQDYGYGIFLLDEKSRAYVLENIQTEKDDFLRTMMWGSLWDSVREAELAPRDYVALVIKNINVEQDESTIQTLLARVSTAMNYYIESVPSASAGGLNADNRNAKLNPSANADGTDKDKLAAQIENLLIDKMQNAPTLGQRITFYRAFLNVASTEKARTILKDILSGKFAIEGLNRRGDGSSSPAAPNKNNANGQGQAQPLQSLLKSKDKFDIVTRLAVLNDSDAPRLLADLQKTETADEAKRYAYAAQAGFPSTENAARYFNDFVGNKELSESYIETAFVPFNSVRHADLTLPYLEKALAELPNLKKNRKIFFVNGWLAAFIGGQKSEQALQIVNKFLAENPNLDKDLRLKILENVDALERAVKIRKIYEKS